MGDAGHGDDREHADADGRAAAAARAPGPPCRGCKSRRGEHADAPTKNSDVGRKSNRKTESTAQSTVEIEVAKFLRMLSANLSTAARQPARGLEEDDADDKA